MAKTISEEIIKCKRCPRLISHGQKVGREKRKAFIHEKYWAKPVPSFGDLKARILIVGLAPAAHGANRTGRMFTGDQSGLWLYRALEKAGLCNSAGKKQEPETAHIHDGLQLKKVMITNVVHCAPPENKPTKEEIQNCSEYLRQEIENFKDVRVYLVLGQIALRGLWKTLPDEWKSSPNLPKFSHGKKVQLKNGKWILCSYHPSQQNTFTKRLTEPMLDEVMKVAGTLK